MKYLLLLNRATDALPEPGTPAARDCSVEVRAIVDTGGGHTGSGR
jgi:hypothetical protein